MRAFVLIALSVLLIASVAFSQQTEFNKTDNATCQRKDPFDEYIYHAPYLTGIVADGDPSDWDKYPLLEWAAVDHWCEGSGQEGWIYGGRLSRTPPEKKSQDEAGNLFAGMSGSKIGADEADTSRSIRGLSSETEQYAKNRGTPDTYKKALDGVLSMGVTEQELEAFLMKGKIGEYAP